MRTFKIWLNEEILIEEELLIEAAGAAADTKGKLRELQVGQYLNAGKHMDSYRVEGKTPSEMHHIHAIKTHGENYEKNDNYKKSQNQSKAAAKNIEAHLKKYGHGNIKRTVWTSQPSDHHSETGYHDTNNSADLIVTTNKTHKRPITEAKTDRSENKVAISVKTGSGNVTYSNPGLKTMSHMAGSDLSTHTTKHENVVKKNLPGKGSSHDKWKEKRDSVNAEDQSKAAKVKHSSLEMNRNVANDLRQGLAKKSHDELHKTITHEVSPKTHLKHIVSRQITHPKTGEELAHHTYDLHKHTHEYLDHFHGLHVDPGGTGASVTVHGTHKKTGKKMAVARVSISAGGRPANYSPKGTVTLPSEDNKDVHYTDKSEHMEH